LKIYFPLIFTSIFTLTVIAEDPKLDVSKLGIQNGTYVLDSGDEDKCEGKSVLIKIVTDNEGSSLYIGPNFIIPQFDSAKSEDHSDETDCDFVTTHEIMTGLLVQTTNITCKDKKLNLTNKITVSTSKKTVKVVAENRKPGKLVSYYKNTCIYKKSEDAKSD